MKDRHSRKLNGTVLIMVVTVMCVLIIMLVATLSVVSTANRRIYTKYEENQAYYTARSLVDIFATSMLSDGDYMTNTAYVSDNAASGATLSQGLALQLDLYKLKASGEAYKLEDTQSLQNTAKQKYENNLLHNVNQSDLRIGANSASYDVDKTMYQNYFGTSLAADKTSVGIKEKDGIEYFEYKMTGFPQVGVGMTNNYTGMIDSKYDSNGNRVGTEVLSTITVEVLEREYDADITGFTKSNGTAYDNNVAGDKEEFFADTHISNGDKIAAILKGKRNEDYIKVRITATTVYGGVEGKEIAILESKPKQFTTPPPNKRKAQFDNALNALGSAAGGSGAMIRVGGGVSQMATAENTKIGDGNTALGGVFTLGKLEWTSNAAVTINNGDSIVAMNGLSFSTNPFKPTPVSYTQVPPTFDSDPKTMFVFLGGESSFIQGNMNEIPLIADTIKLWGDNPWSPGNYSTLNDFTLKDGYIKTLDMTHATNDGPSGWTPKMFASGKVYVNELVLPDEAFASGTLDLSLLPMDHIILTKDCIVRNQYEPSDPRYKKYQGAELGMFSTIRGSVDRPGTTNQYDRVDITENFMDTHYTSSVASIDMSIEASNNFGAAKGGYETVTIDGRIYRKYYVPFSVADPTEAKDPAMSSLKGSNRSEYDALTGHVIYVPTAQSHFQSYFKEDAFDPDTGDLKEGAPGKAIYSEENKDYWKLSALDFLEASAETTIVPEKDGSGNTNPRTIKKAIQELGDKIKPLSQQSTITLTDDIQYFYIDGNIIDKTITVTNPNGKSGRVIILGEENKTFKIEQSLIVTDDITPTTTTINAATTPAPPIEYYIGAGSKLDGNGKWNMLSGYFVMPQADMGLTIGKNGGGDKYIDADGNVVNLSRFLIVGSVFCNDFSALNNDVGIAYINPNNGNNNNPNNNNNNGVNATGEPVLNWNVLRYVRK